MNAINQHKNNSYFFYTILALCLSYLLYQFIFIPYWALTADEFVFARHISEYTYHLPYRDFPPYKTVLGYYLLSIPMFFSHALLAPIFYIKNEIALINAACIAITCYWSTRIFAKRAVLFTLLAIMLNQVFMIYATDLRVDMLTCWMCLFAILAGMQHRFGLSGALMGIAFLISQKALWYIGAINGGIFFCWLLFPQSSYNVRALLKFNIATSLPILAYIAFWSLLTSPYKVLYNLFYEAYIQAGIDYYLDCYLPCWQSILARGPLLFLLWPLTFLSLFGKHNTDSTAQKNVFSIACGSIALIAFIHYKQAFPYNFVFTIPALFLLYANFLTWILTTPRDSHTASSTGISLNLVYGGLIFAIVYAFQLPNAYYTIALIPLGLYLSLTTQRKNKLAQHAILVLTIVLGLVYPLTDTIRLSFFDGRYQQTMIQLTAKLLAKNGDYVGGMPFLYNKEQPIDGMKNLITPAIDYLYQPTAKLELLLLPSLYLTPTSTEKVLSDFEKSSVKVILNNYRMSVLPPTLRTYIKNNYQHFYGSIYLYAPVIQPRQLSFNLKFTGNYKLDGKTSIRLDGKKVRPQQIIALKQGDHISDAQVPYRLVLIPDLGNEKLNPAYQRDVYTFMNKAILA